jgi:hypothetical protein
MSARRARATAAVAWLSIAAALAAPGASAAAAPALSVSRSHVATRVGGEFGFTTVITNPGTSPLRGLVAHLDVVSLDSGVYVDPEDWSSERTRYLPPIAPGRSITVPWTVQAVNAGHFAIYAVAVGAGRPTAGPALDVRVAQHKTIDAGGALRLAVAVPGLLGLAMLGVRARRPR